MYSTCHGGKSTSKGIKDQKSIFENSYYSSELFYKIVVLFPILRKLFQNFAQLLWQDPRYTFTIRFASGKRCL